MPLNNLHELISLLESREELVRITAECDPLLEIAAITDRVSKMGEGGQALLFEQPTGSAFPVGVNLFGSLHRTSLALEVENLGQLTTKMTALLARIPLLDIQQLDQQISAVHEFSRFAPPYGSPAWNEVMAKPDLALFPLLQNFAGDGAASGNPRYITLPQVITAEPDGANPNCGVYRAQVVGSRELAIRWKAGSGAARHLEAFSHRGKPMPVAIALGGPPAVLFSAMMPLPGDLDEMTFAGFLRGAPVETAGCRTVPLQVPSHAEVVIEGFINPAETFMEGPFGNHTGFYSPAGPAALMRVSAISHRPEAIIPATIVGPPPMEDCWMGKAWERVLLAFLGKLLPEISDIHFPLEWIFHQSAIISLEHPEPGMVREIAGKLWEMSWFSEARLLIFVDAGTSADLSETAWRCINLADATHDLIQDPGRNRLALDATGCRLPQAGIVRDSAVMQRVLQRWQEYGIPLK